MDYIRETTYGSLEVELDEALTKCDQNGFEPRPRPERREQPPQVAADSVRCKMQLVRDLRGGLPLDEQWKHIELAM